MAKNNKTSQHQTFFSLLDSLDIPRPVPEHRFHPVRLWRFDYAWIDQRIALEVEGGIFIQGRHSRGVGMQGDFEKYNEAAVLGWRIIKCTPKDLFTNNTIKLIQRIVNY